RSLNSPALMVLRLKAWESKSPPGLQNRMYPSGSFSNASLVLQAARFFVGISWSGDRSITINYQVGA
ncbi:MAG: hypothetical protein AAFR21_15910, partial [Pseudomonadota bacterium]